MRVHLKQKSKEHHAPPRGVSYSGPSFSGIPTSAPVPVPVVDIGKPTSGLPSKGADVSSTGGIQQQSSISVPEGASCNFGKSSNLPSFCSLTTLASHISCTCSRHTSTSQSLIPSHASLIEEQEGVGGQPFKGPSASSGQAPTHARSPSSSWTNLSSSLLSIPDFLRPAFSFGGAISEQPNAMEMEQRGQERQAGQGGPFCQSAIPSQAVNPPSTSFTKIEKQ